MMGNNTMMSGLPGPMGFGFPNQGGFANGMGWNGMSNMMPNGGWNSMNPMGMASCRVFFSSAFN